VVTLAGVGAVGVTINSAMWTPVWALLAIVGHAVSIALRRLRVPAESVFYPVMVLGAAVVIQLSVSGSPLVGLEVPLSVLTPDMATATVVGALAVLRTFTLLTNGSLVFSPVPSITMLALVGSTNPNAEVPVFFGLLLLGALFLTGYETHLRRLRQTGRPAGPVVTHLLMAWCVALAGGAAALAFPLIIQPVIGPLSPFSLPAMGRLQALTNFSQAGTRQAPVGQGPIRLSPTPIFNIYTSEGGLFRTAVYTEYTGRSWVMSTPPDATDIQSSQEVALEGSLPGAGSAIRYDRSLFYFRFPRDPELGPGVATRMVPQTIETVGYVTDGVPALGRIRELRYPRRNVTLHANGTVSGGGHQGVGRVTQVVSEVVEIQPEHLRRAPSVDAGQFSEPETLELPNSTLRVQRRAREVTQGIENPYEKVRAIVAHIEATCTYTLQEEPTPQGVDATEFYLFETRRGACDLAATTAAVMCRAVGIPARVAVGYVAEEPLPEGQGWLIRQEHAHMWMEAYFPGIGWATFDFSPPATDLEESALRLAWFRLTAALRRVGGGGMDAVLLIAVLALTLLLGGTAVLARLRTWLRERRAERLRRAAAPGAALAFAYVDALRHLERRGWRRDPAATPLEYLEAMRAEWPALPEGAAALSALESLTRCYLRAHYANESAPALWDQASAAVAVLRRLAPVRPRLRPEPAASGVPAEAH
jgi:transglutaminase-like putative cysteine protease